MPHLAFLRIAPGCRRLTETMLRPSLTASELRPEDARGLVDELRYSSKVPETPTVVLDNVRPGENDHKDEDNVSVHIRCGGSTAIGDCSVEADRSGTFVHDNPHNRHHTDSAEAD